MDIRKLRIIVSAYLDGTLPRRHRSVVARWLASDFDAEAKDKVLREDWERGGDACEGVGASADSQSPEQAAQTAAALERFRAERRSASHRVAVRRRITRMVRWAAVLVLPILGAAAAWLYSGKYYAHEQLVEFNVPEGKIDSLTLSDGTKVIVNSASTVLYPRSFNRLHGNRDVFLIGEAHFKVSKDKEHPFIVHSGRLSVRVLGTQFNVKAYPREQYIVTTLEEGSVHLSDGRMALTMKPGEQVSYDRGNGSMMRSQVEVADFNLWSTGALDFIDMSLGRILDRVSQRFDVHFVVGKGIDLSRHYNMNFRHGENVDDIMAVVTRLIGNGHYTYNKQRRTITLYKR